MALVKPAPVRSLAVPNLSASSDQALRAWPFYTAGEQTGKPAIHAGAGDSAKTGGYGKLRACIQKVSQPCDRFHMRMDRVVTEVSDAIRRAWAGLTCNDQ